MLYINHSADKTLSVSSEPVGILVDDGFEMVSAMHAGKESSVKLAGIVECFDIAYAGLTCERDSRIKLEGFIESYLKS